MSYMPPALTAFYVADVTTYYTSGVLKKRTKKER